MKIIFIAFFLCNCQEKISTKDLESKDTNQDFSPDVIIYDDFNVKVQLDLEVSKDLDFKSNMDSTQDGTGPSLDMPFEQTGCDSIYPECESFEPISSTMIQTYWDLSDPYSIKRGRCDHGSANGILLPSKLSEYPLLIRVSGKGFKGGCSYCIDLIAEVVKTRYGLSFSKPDTRPYFSLAVSVNSPWQIVSGGTGEANAHPCLEGYSRV